MSHARRLVVRLTCSSHHLLVVPARRRHLVLTFRLQGWEQYFFVKRSTMHTMCSQAPAVFELLPDPQVPNVWPHNRPAPTATVILRNKAPAKPADASGDSSDDAKQALAGASSAAPPVAAQRGTRTDRYSIADFRNLLQASLKEFEVETYGGKKVTLEMNPECWTISDAARDRWRQVELPDGCEFFNCFGTGFSTAYDVEYGSIEEPLEDVTEIARGEPVRNFSSIEGDCTVPVCCATAGGFHVVICLQQYTLHWHICNATFLTCVVTFDTYFTIIQLVVKQVQVWHRDPGHI